MTRDANLIPQAEVERRLGIGPRKLLSMEMEPAFPNREVILDGVAYWCEIDIEAYLQKVRKQAGVSNPKDFKASYMNETYQKFQDPVAIKMMGDIKIEYWRERGDKRLDVSPEDLRNALKDVFAERVDGVLRDITIMSMYAKKYTIDYSFLWSVLKVVVARRNVGSTLEESLYATIDEFLSTMGSSIRKGALN